jgi:hypothetical protein
MRKAGENKEEYEDLEIALKVMKEIREYRAIGTVEEITNLIKFLSFDDDTSILEDLRMLVEYYSIGTVEEFKALKEKNGWHDMEMYGLGYNQGTIDRADEFQKCREQGYNKAIDEFAERLKDSLKNNFRHLLSVDTDGFEWLTTDAVGTHIDEIAEKMKGGAE